MRHISHPCTKQSLQNLVRKHVIRLNASEPHVACALVQAQKEPKAAQQAIKLPQNAERDLVSAQYPTFAHESAYALAGSVVKNAILPNADSLRHLDSEGVHIL